MRLLDSNSKTSTGEAALDNLKIPGCAKLVVWDCEVKAFWSSRFPPTLASKAHLLNRLV